MPTNHSFATVVVGSTPPIDALCMYAAAASAMWVELIDKNGITQWEGSVTGPNAAAVPFATLIANTIGGLAAGPAAVLTAAWANSCGMRISVTTGPIYVNASAPAGVANVNASPSASSPTKLLQGDVYAFGVAG